jgi:hypothetical protein
MQEAVLSLAPRPFPTSAIAEADFISPEITVAMNGRLDRLIAKQLMPALEKSQGFVGTYARGDQTWRLTAIPTDPDWTSEDDKAAIEEWTGVVFLVSVREWERTGLAEPKHGDRYTVVLADGQPRTYALLREKGKRPYDMPAGATHYSLRMKWVKG